MALKSMKLSAEERKEQSYPCCVGEGEEGPSYPYGLCIDLNNDVLDKLGITQLPAVGTEVMIMCKARVTSVSSYESEGSEARRSTALQITDMELGPAMGASPSLYGENT